MIEAPITGRCTKRLPSYARPASFLALPRAAPRSGLSYLPSGPRVLLLACCPAEDDGGWAWMTIGRGQSFCRGSASSRESVQHAGWPAPPPSVSLFLTLFCSPWLASALAGQSPRPAASAAIGPMWGDYV